MITLATLSACGGGGSPTAYTNENGEITGTGFSGKAATGAPIANAVVTIKSLTGASITTQTDANGDFNSSELKEATASTRRGPYLLRVGLGNNRNLYSIAYSENATTVDANSMEIAVNIHPYTDLIIRNWFAMQGLDIDNVFASGSIASLPTTDEIDAISGAFLSLLNEVLAANGAPTNVDLLSTPFTIGDGFDRFLDNSTVIINNQINIIISQPDTINAIQNAIVENVDVATDFTSADDDPPTTPQNLRALAASTSEVVVVWDSSSDDKGVAGYHVYRDGTLIGTTAFPMFSDSGLSTGVNYSYTVEAFDGRGQLSAMTPVSTDITLDTPDTTAPPAITALQASEGSDTAELTWSTDNIDDVSGFRIYRGASGNVNTAAAPLATVTSTHYSDFDVAAGTTYCYRIVTFDAAGNDSSASDESCVTISGTVTDPSSVGFSATAYSVSENAGSFTVTVNRYGDLSQAISVDYAATALTATAGVDFVETSGTLNWSATDSSAKTFTVQINENSETEANETVQLSLSNPSANSTLGTAASAELTITDAPQVACIDLSPTSITTDTTLSAPCYNVKSNLSVSNAATLTIDPGVRLVFAAGINFEISEDGLLSAIGTEQQPITFTGALAAPGYWDGIEIRSLATSQLNHVVVEYGGNSTSFNPSNVGISFDGRLSLSNSVIRHSAAYGVSLISNATLAAFTGNTITLNEDSPLHIFAQQAGMLAPDNSFSGNVTSTGGDKDYIELEGSVNSNQTWHLFDVDYRFTGSSNINAELIIAPGVTLVFPAGAQLYVQDAGILKAIGTAAQPITFTGLMKSDGYWDGIQFTFNNNDNILDHTIVEYGGASSNSNANVGVFGQNGRLTIKNSMLRHSAAYGFSFDTGIDLTMSNVTSTANNQPGTIELNELGMLDSDSTYSGNTDDRIVVTSSTVSADQTIHHLDVPYHFAFTTQSSVAAALTIEAGTEIQFDADSGLNVNSHGTLIAQGTASEPIVFTGVQKSKGYWKGIQFTFSNNPNVLDHTVVEYAGAPGGNTEALVGFFGSGSLVCTGSVTNSILRGSQTNGIWIESDTSGDFITGNTFEDIDGEDIYTNP